MNYLHTMIRVADLDAAPHFFCELLGLKLVSRRDHEQGRFTLVFLCAPEDEERARAEPAPMVELTYNWPDADGKAEQYTGGRNFGHLAYRVEDIYAACQLSWMRGRPSTARRATATWPSCARPTASRTYQTLKLLHVLAAVAFVGNTVVGMFWYSFAVRTGDAKIVAHVIQGLNRGDRVFTLYGGIALFLTGATLTWPGGFPLAGGSPWIFVWAVSDEGVKCDKSFTAY